MGYINQNLLDIQNLFRPCESDYCLGYMSITIVWVIYSIRRLFELYTMFMVSKLYRIVG